MAVRTSAGKRKGFGAAGLKRRSELMDAAVRLSARNGFAQTRVSDIVGKVGVGQGVFYWYFESKDALFAEILSDLRRRLRRFQGAFIEDEPDPIRRIARGIVASMDFMIHNRHVFAMLDHAARRPGYRPDREARRIHVIDVVRHVEEAVQRGIIRKADPEFLAHGIAGMVERMSYIYLGNGSRLDVDAVAQETIDFVLGGLLGSSAISVADIRAGMVVTPELSEIRDRVGSLAPASERAVPAPPNGNGRAAPRGG